MDPKPSYSAARTGQSEAWPRKRRARITLAAAALGLALLAALVVFFRDPVRDHLEAWHFQLTRQTELILPVPFFEPGELHSKPITRLKDMKPLRVFELTEVCRQLASSTSTAVIVDRELSRYLGMLVPLDDSSRLSTMGEGELMLFILQEGGYRVLQQRFPRRAYVVLGSSNLPAYPSKALAPWPREPILWDGLDPPVRIERPFLQLPRDTSTERP